MPPGTIYKLASGDIFDIALAKVRTVHGTDAVELLAIAKLINDLCQKVTIIGIEPEIIETRIGLLNAAQYLIPRALKLVIASSNGYLGN